MSDEQPPKTEVINSVTVELPRSSLLQCGAIQCRFKISSLFGKRVMFTRRALINEEFWKKQSNKNNNNQDPQIKVDLGAVLSGYSTEKNGFGGKEIEPCLFVQPANDSEAEFHKMKLPEQTFPKDDVIPSDSKDFSRSTSVSFSCSQILGAGGKNKANNSNNNQKINNNNNSNNNSQSGSGYLHFKTKVMNNLDEDAAETSAFSTRVKCGFDFVSSFAENNNTILSLPQPVHLTLKLGLEKLEIYPFHPKSIDDLKKLSQKAEVSTSFPMTWRLNSDLPKADQPDVLFRMEFREKETDKHFFRCYECPFAPAAENMAACWSVRNSVTPLPSLPAPQKVQAERNGDEEKVVSSNLENGFFLPKMVVSVSLAEETQREQIRAKAKTMLQKIDDAKLQIRNALNQKLEHDEKYHFQDRDGDGHADEQEGPFIALNKLRERVVLFVQKTDEADDNDKDGNNISNQAKDKINDLVTDAQDALSPEKIAGQLKSVEQCLRAFTASIKNPFVDPGQAFHVAMEEMLTPEAAAKITETMSAAFTGLKSFQGDLVSAAGKAADAVADLLAPVASAALGALGNVLGELGGAVAGVAADIVQAVPFIGMFVAPLISIGKKIYKQYNEKKLADAEVEKLLSRLSEHFEWFKRYQDFTKLLEKRGAQVRKLLAKAQLTIADCFDAVQEDKSTSATMKFITATGRQERFASLRADLDATFALIEKEIQFGFMFETLGEVKDISAKIDKQMAEEAKRAAEMQAQMKELATLMPGQLKKKAKELSEEAAYTLVEQTKQKLRRCVRSVHPEMIDEVPNEMGRSIQFSLDKKYVPIYVRQHVSSATNIKEDIENNNNALIMDNHNNNNGQQNDDTSNNNNKYNTDGMTYKRSKMDSDLMLSRDFNDGDDDAMLIGGKIVARKSENLFRASTANSPAALNFKRNDFNKAEDYKQSLQSMNNNNNAKNNNTIASSSTVRGGELQDLNTVQFADRITRLSPPSRVVVLDGVSSIGKSSFAQKLCLEQQFPSYVAVYFSIAKYVNSNNNSSRDSGAGDANNSRFWKLLRKACTVSAMSDFMIHVIEEQHIPILWIVDDVELVQTNKEAIEFLQEFVCPIGRQEHIANDDPEDTIVRSHDLVLAVMRDPHRTAPGVDFFSPKSSLAADHWGVRSWDPEAVKSLPHKFFRVACAPDAKVLVERINNCLTKSPAFQTSPFFAQLLSELVLRGGATADRIKKGRFEANTTQLLELVVKESWNRDSTFNKIRDRYGSVVHSEGTFNLMINGAGYHSLKYMRRQVSLEFTVNVAPDNWAWLLTQADLTQFAGFQQRVFLDLSYVEYFAAQYILRHMEAIDTIPWDNDQRVVWMHVTTLLAFDVDRMNERDRLLEAIGRNVAREFNDLPAQDRIFGWKYSASSWGRYRRDLAMNLLCELASILDAGYTKFPRIGRPGTKSQQYNNNNNKSKNNSNNNNNNSSSSSGADSSSSSVKSETFEAVLAAMDAYAAEEVPLSFNLSKFNQVGTWLGKKIPTVGGPIGEFIKKSQDTARNARQRATALYNVTNRPWMLWLVEPCGRTGCKTGVEWLLDHVMIEADLWNESLYGAFESKPSFSSVLLQHGAKVELKKACEMGAHNAVRSLIQMNKISPAAVTGAATTTNVTHQGGGAAAASTTSRNANNKQNNNNNNNTTTYTNQQQQQSAMKLPREKFQAVLQECLRSSAETRQAEVAFELLDGVTFSKAGLSITAALRCVRDGPQSISQKLTRLDLRDCALGNDGVVEVLEGPLPSLEILSLAKNNIGPGGFEFFARVAPLVLPKLRYVNLSRNSGFLCGILMIAPVLLSMPDLAEFNISDNNVQENIRERYTTDEQLIQHLTADGKQIKGILGEVMRTALNCFGLDGACYSRNDDIGYGLGGEGIRRLMWLFGDEDSTGRVRRTKPLQRISFAGSHCGVGGMTYLFEADKHSYGEISTYIDVNDTSNSNNNNNDDLFGGSSSAPAGSPTDDSLFFGSSNFNNVSPMNNAPSTLRTICNPPQLFSPSVRRAEMFSRVIELDLSGCAMDGNAVQKLYDAVISLEPPKWRSLSLANNPIGQDGGDVALSELLRFLRDSPLTVLNLRSCQLGVNSFFNLHGPMRVLRQLKSIDLSDNNMNHPSVFGLVADIQNIEIVNLARNNIELLTLVEVIPQLEKMRRVLNLDLSFNSIDESSLRLMKKKLPRKEALLMFQ